METILKVNKTKSDSIRHGVSLARSRRNSRADRGALVIEELLDDNALLLRSLRNVQSVILLGTTADRAALVMQIQEILKDAEEGFPCHLLTNS